MRAPIPGGRGRGLAAAGGAAFVAVLIVQPLPARVTGWGLWRESVARTEASAAAADLAAVSGRLPLDSRVLRDLGWARFRTGDLAGAAEAWQAAIRTSGEADLHLEVAYVHLTLGDTARALLHADSAIAVFPDRVHPHVVAALVHRAAGRDAEARTALARALAGTTRVRSEEVERLESRARTLWTTWYDDPAPGPVNGA